MQTMKKILAAALLLEQGHEVVGVVTRIDKAAGRGKVLTPPAVKIAAGQSGVPVFQPKRVREPESIAAIRAMGEVAVAAWQPRQQRTRTHSRRRTSVLPL